MKIQKIQPLNFDARNRYITPKMQDDMKIILEKMNNNTILNENGDYFQATVLKELSNIKNNVRFIDCRMYIDKVPKCEQMKRETLLKIGKTQLVINNETGEIVKCNKSIFTPWYGIMGKLYKYLDFFKENFDNKDKVVQKRLTMSGFTKAGRKKVENIKKYEFDS